MVERDLWLVFEGNVIVRLFSEPLPVSSEAIVFLIDPYKADGSGPAALVLVGPVFSR